jgi:hypothetical protein
MAASQSKVRELLSRIRKECALPEADLLTAELQKQLLEVEVN